MRQIKVNGIDIPVFTMAEMDTILLVANTLNRQTELIRDAPVVICKEENEIEEKKSLLRSLIILNK
jgi:hypothetical protein